MSRQTQLATHVQVAGNGKNRRKGLLGREALREGEGLWIVPCEAVHTFWMRFPIDLIYLDRQHRVLKTRSNVPAWRMSACVRAHSVLELAAGVVFRTQTMPGDVLNLEASPSFFAEEICAGLDGRANGASCACESDFRNLQMWVVARKGRMYSTVEGFGAS